MKKLLLIIIFASSYFCLNLNAKTPLRNEFYFEVIDSLGNKDSVWIHFVNDSLATEGIDSAYNEVNLFGTPYSDLDLRLIQRRDTADTLIYPDKWLKGWVPIKNFKNNIDLKNEYRTRNISSDVFKRFNNSFDFVLQIKAKHFPVILKGRGNVMEWDIVCAQYNPQDIWHEIDSSNYYRGMLYKMKDSNDFTFYTFYDSTQLNLIAFSPFFLGDEISEHERTDFFANPINISPNPVSGGGYNLNISIPNFIATGQQDIQFTIYDNKANCVKFYIFNNEQTQYQLEISSLANGTYFILNNVKNYNNTVLKFIKE